jgi:predicted phage tail protein
MLRDIYLYGSIGKRFGRHFRLAVESPAEALRAIICLRPGVEREIRKGYWRIILGSPHLNNTLPYFYMTMKTGDLPIHFVPATPPAGGDGVGKIAIGVVMIGLAVAVPMIGIGMDAAIGFSAAMATSIGFAGITFGNIALLGLTLVIGGLAQLMTTPPTQDTSATDKATAPEDRPSYLFQGVTNNSQQGAPVPLVYGTFMTGSVVVSAGIVTEDIGY